MSQSPAAPTENAAPATPHVAPPMPEKSKPHKRLILIPFALVIALVLVFYIRGLGYEVTDDAFIEGHVGQVSARVPGHIQKVLADDNQPVAAGQLLFELDPADYKLKLEQARAALEATQARVEAAQISVTLTSGTTSAGVEQASSGVDLARSALESSHAQIATAKSMKRQAEAQLGSATSDANEEKANVQAAEAEAGQAKADLERYRNLMDQGAVSRQQLDLATTAERTARAKLESARQKQASAEAKANAARAAVQTAEQSLLEAESQVAQAQARIGEASGRLNSANTGPHQVAVTRAQLKGLSAELAQAQTAVSQAQLNLDYTKIYAPDNGRVTRKNAEVGNYVQAGQAVLALVPEKVWVVANFKETQLTHMKQGQPVVVRVDAYPSLSLKGHVDSIQAGTGARFSLLPPENASGNFVKVVQRVPVKIVLDELPGKDFVLAPGMSVVPEVKVK